MLLSFSPKWYDDLSSGRKIYEHRKRFFKEPVIAYIYLGLPYRQIVAKVELGAPIPMEKWLNDYKSDPEAICRIKDFMQRSNVAMPILSFQKMKPIDAREMEKKIQGFRVPISYMFLDDKPELNDYVTSREILVGEKIVHNFDHITSEDICIC